MQSPNSTSTLTSVPSMENITGEDVKSKTSTKKGASLPRRKMTEEEIEAFVKQKKATLSADSIAEAHQRNETNRSILEHIVKDKDSQKLLPPSQLPQTAAGNLLPDTTDIKSRVNQQSSDLKSSTEEQGTTTNSSIQIEKDAPIAELENELYKRAFETLCKMYLESASTEDQQWIWSRFSNKMKLEISRLPDKIDEYFHSKETSSRTSNDKDESVNATIDNDLKAKARRIASMPYNEELDVHCPIGIYPYVLMAWTGPSQKCTTKTSKWALRCFGGFSSPSEFESEVDKIRQKNPYAINLDFFALTVGGGKGGALFPPDKRSIQDQKYANKELEKFMNQHNAEIDKSNKYHDERLANKIDPNPHIKKARESYRDRKQERKIGNKIALQKQRNAHNLATERVETYGVRKADGTIELRKREPKVSLTALKNMGSEVVPNEESS